MLLVLTPFFVVMLQEARQSQHYVLHRRISKERHRWRFAWRGEQKVTRLHSKILLISLVLRKRAVFTALVIEQRGLETGWQEVIHTLS